MLTDERLAEIRARWKRATKGPWEHGAPSEMTFGEMRHEYAASLKATLDHFGDYENRVHGVYLADSEVRVCITGISPNSPANAAFIANARQDIGDLLAEIERLQAEVQRLSSQAGVQILVPDATRRLLRERKRQCPPMTAAR